MADKDKVTVTYVGDSSIPDIFDDIDQVTFDDGDDLVMEWWNDGDSDNVIRRVIIPREQIKKFDYHPSDDN